MTGDNKLVKKFQVEELESRYEMGWTAKKVNYSYTAPNGGTVGGSINI